MKSIYAEENEWIFCYFILHLTKNQVIPTGSQVVVFNTFESHLK